MVVTPPGGLFLEFDLVLLPSRPGNVDDLCDVVLSLLTIAKVRWSPLGMTIGLSA